MNNTNILLTREAIDLWEIEISKIRLDIDGRVWIIDNEENMELTNLIWAVCYTPCAKENHTIIITKCKKEEE